MSEQMSHRDDYNEAFEEAIRAGVLSADEKAPNWAGEYMYMFTQGKADAFKHRLTRKYVYHTH